MSGRTPIAFDFTAINAAMERLHRPGGQGAIPARAGSVTFKIEATTMLKDALEWSAQKHAASIAQSIHDFDARSPSPFPILPAATVTPERWIGAGPADPVYQFCRAEFNGVQAVRFAGVEQPEFRHRMTGFRTGPDGFVVLRVGAGGCAWNGLVEIVLARPR